MMTDTEDEVTSQVFGMAGVSISNQSDKGRSQDLDSAQSKVLNSSKFVKFQKMARKP